MAKVTLTTQAEAEASPYFFKFYTLSSFDNSVVAKSFVNGTQREFRASSLANLLTRLSSFETYRSDNGKTTHS